LLIKNIYGGTSSEITFDLSDYYLPCEITHITTHLYSTKFLELNKNLKSFFTITKGLGGIGYNQDSYVQLITSGTPKYYNIYNMGLLYNSNFIDVSNTEFKYDNGVKINILGNNEFEQSKGGNFISGPKNGDNKIPIFYIDGASAKYLDILRSLEKCILVELKCSFKSSGFRHIDELMCFMPYGNGKFKVWFYDSFDEQILNDERKENLEKISQALFGKPYEEAIDKFVFFKYDMDKPSLFNRSWIEYGDKCYCLFPILSKEHTKLIMLKEQKQELLEEIQELLEEKQELVEEQIKYKTENIKIITEKLKENTRYTKFYEEIEKLSSCLTNLKPKIIFVKVPAQNDEIPVGGVHCMIKQRFISVD